MTSQTQTKAEKAATEAQTKFTETEAALTAAQTILAAKQDKLRAGVDVPSTEFADATHEVERLTLLLDGSRARLATAQQQAHLERVQNILDDANLSQHDQDVDETLDHLRTTLADLLSACDRHRQAVQTVRSELERAGVGASASAGVPENGHIGWMPILTGGTVIFTPVGKHETRDFKRLLIQVMSELDKPLSKPIVTTRDSRPISERRRGIPVPASSVPTISGRQ